MRGTNEAVEPVHDRGATGLLEVQEQQQLGSPSGEGEVGDDDRSGPRASAIVRASQEALHGIVKRPQMPQARGWPRESAGASGCVRAQIYRSP